MTTADALHPFFNQETRDGAFPKVVQILVKRLRPDPKNPAVGKYATIRRVPASALAGDDAAGLTPEDQLRAIDGHGGHFRLVALSDGGRFAAETDVELDGDEPPLSGAPERPVERPAEQPRATVVQGPPAVETTPIERGIATATQAAGLVMPILKELWDRSDKRRAEEQRRRDDEQRRADERHREMMAAIMHREPAQPAPQANPLDLLKQVGDVLDVATKLRATAGAEDAGGGLRQTLEAIGAATQPTLNRFADGLAREVAPHVAQAVAAQATAE